MAHAIDKVYAPVNLKRALSTVIQRKTSPGIDGRSAATVASDAETEVATLDRDRQPIGDPAGVKRSAIKWPREKGQKHLKECIRERTCRDYGQSLETIITRVNQVVRGWGH